MGYATSSMMKKVILDYFTAHDIKNWNVETSALNMSQSLTGKADLIVSSLGLSQSEFKVPVINGVPLISGVGKEKTLQEIVAAIRKIDDIGA